ncbi:hypothetical protein EW15_1267 [Prochlorococcus sp. MIT 0801]|nr:hypothetical protein EW15_1267 [Prochlorococcus sp. MIT 0801]
MVDSGFLRSLTSRQNRDLSLNDYGGRIRTRYQVLQKQANSYGEIYLIGITKIKRTILLIL